jgi:hypothetical protein
VCSSIVLVEAAARLLRRLPPAGVGVLRRPHEAEACRAPRAHIALRALRLEAVRGVRIDALPVVEVKEHRRTPGDGAKQITEPAQRVRPDHVALVFGEVFPRRALAGEDVEVIEPEVGHHFLELPIAVDGAENLLLGELGDHFALLARHFHLLGGARLLLRRVGRGALVGQLRLAPRHLRGHVVVFGDLPAAERQRLESGQPSRHRRIGDPLRRELLVDVPGQPDLAHPFDISGAGAEPDAVQHVQDRLVVGTARNGRAGKRGGRQRRGGNDDGGRTCQKRHAH